MWATDFSQGLHEQLDAWEAGLYNLDLSLLKPDEEKFLRSPEVKCRA